MTRSMLNAYESLIGCKFKGTKEELIQQIELNLRDATLKTWTKRRLEALKERINKII